jgi:two-component system, NarL family, response regulator DevR
MPRGHPRRDPFDERRPGSAGGKETRVLVVDDYAFVRTGLPAMLEAEDSIKVVAEVETSATVSSRWAGPRPDVAVLPVRPGHPLGVRAIGQIRARWPETQVLVILQREDKEALFASIRAGASGYLSAETSHRDLVRAVHAVAAGQTMIDPMVTAPVIDQVRRSHHQPGEEKLARLSADEQRVLTLVAQGKTNREIAHRLGQSLATAKKRVSSILTKLEVSRRSEAAAYLAQRRGSGDESGDA